MFSSLSVPPRELSRLSFQGRVRIEAVQKCESYLDTVITVGGWTRTVRKQGKLAFVTVSDGSCARDLQVVVSGEHFAAARETGAGCSVLLRGRLVKSPAKGQLVEMKVCDEDHSFRLLGGADQGTYPLAKKAHTREYLREQGHLRCRTRLIGAVARVRSQLAAATHAFFQQRGFLYLHTPVITASDCEGAGELFRVDEDSAWGVSDKKSDDADKGPTPNKMFFKKPAYLTCSGQLAAETYAVGMGDVYTFGPTFRAEHSHTSRHLAEFWMIEPEMAFCELPELMDCAEAYVRFCLLWVLQNNVDDLAVLEELRREAAGLPRVDEAEDAADTLVTRLGATARDQWKRIPYTEAVELLEKADAKFERAVSWGIDLGSEHERWLTDVHFKCPVIVHNYPAAIKAFYMKRDEADPRTVRCIDMLVPGIGELIGGSQREDDLAALEARLKADNLPLENYSWYLDLRRYGSVPHSGFGLGFERLVMLCTGIENIRDTIPFPRWPGNADF